MNYHLAHVNVAFGKYVYSDPRFAGFVDNLDRINAIADESPGFVWRMANECEDEEAKRLFGDDKVIFNMSVWESTDALHAFTYQTDHVEIMRQRSSWFVPQKQPTTVLWWKAAGQLPTVAEAKDRLDLLAERGPTLDAFTFRQQFSPPTDQAVSG